MKKAIVTGATGFLGYWLLKELIKNNVFVYAIVRKNSKRREKLIGVSGIKVIELDMEEIYELPRDIKDADVFYHLAWDGERNNFNSQIKNIQWSKDSIQAAYEIGVKQFIVTGSQAEYGICNEKVDESYPTNPNTAYGACKLACYNILKTFSEQIELPLTWVRVFSVYGEGDNPNTLISYLFKCFKENKVPKLTSGNQMWDFLYAEDAARALFLLGQKNKYGIYNLASGKSRSLKEFIQEAKDLINPNLQLKFGSNENYNGIELRADIGLIKEKLLWEPSISFKDGILNMLEI